MNPAEVFAPGVAVELVGRGVQGDAAVIVGGREVDPAGGFAPGVPAEGVAAAVDAVVAGTIIGVVVRSAAAEAAEPNPADIFGPDIAFQMVGVDLYGTEVIAPLEPAGIFRPGVLVDRVKAGGEQWGAKQQPRQQNQGIGMQRKWRCGMRVSPVKRL